MSYGDTPPASYNGLPKELKLGIWEQASNDTGRVIAPKYRPREPPNKKLGKLKAYRRILHGPVEVQQLGGIDVRDEAQMSKYTYYSFSALHSRLYYVDDAARETILKRSDRMFPEDSHHEYITADLTKDVLLATLGRQIRPVFDHYMFMASPEQRTRLRYVAVEGNFSLPHVSWRRPWDRGFQFPLLLSRRRVRWNRRFVRNMFVKLRDSLEMLMLMDWSMFGLSVGTDYEWELISIQAEPFGTPTRFFDNFWIKSGMIGNTPWRIDFARRTPSGQSVVTLIVYQYYKCAGGKLKVWDAEKREYIEEVIGEDQPQRALAQVERLARHCVATANRASTSYKG